jgi:hypothetical protein
LCSTSQPLFSQSRKLTLVPYDKKSLPASDTAQKVILSREPSSKFGLRKYRGIDLSSEGFLQRAKHRHDLAERHAAYEKNIYIAITSLLPFHDGSIDKRYFDLGGEWLKSGSQDISQTCRLDDYGVQFLENGAFPVGLIEDLSATSYSSDNAAVRKLCQFPLNRPLSDTSNPHNLSDVEKLVSVREEKS